VTVADALLVALGAVAVGSGALVVTSSHLVRAGLYLVISLGAIAGLYLVLGAELVAWVQVLVYVGAVVVLLLFAVMLTRAPIGRSDDLDRPAWPALLVGSGVGLGLAVLLVDAFRWSIHPLPVNGDATRMGEQIFGNWVLPFEVISILLLAALVGAIVVSRPDLGARRATGGDSTVGAAPGTGPPPDTAATAPLHRPRAEEAVRVPERAGAEEGAQVKEGARVEGGGGAAEGGRGAEGEPVAEAGRVEGGA
jgi:NADH:ubiquinone oxidoreductase subunit 6 (subunit J)